MSSVDRYLAFSGPMGYAIAILMTVAIIGASSSLFVSCLKSGEVRNTFILRILQKIALTAMALAFAATVVFVNNARNIAIKSIIPANASGSTSYAMRDNTVIIFPLVNRSNVPESLSKIHVSEHFEIAMDSQLFAILALSFSTLLVFLCLLILSRSGSSVLFLKSMSRESRVISLLIIAPLLVSTLAIF